jgi:hypothetical protein
VVWPNANIGIVAVVDEARWGAVEMRSNENVDEVKIFFAFFGPIFLASSGAQHGWALSAQPRHGQTPWQRVVCEPFMARNAILDHAKHGSERAGHKLLPMAECCRGGILRDVDGSQPLLSDYARASS